MQKDKLSSLATIILILNASACSNGGGGYSSASNGNSASASASSAPGSATDIWRAHMLTFGNQHCQQLKSGGGSFDDKLSATYYDAERVFYQIADYTGDSSWIQCAQAAENIYRDQYVLPNNGDVPGFWNFSEGLLQDFMRTGDEKSRAAVNALADNAAFARDNTAPEATVDQALSRETAYAINSYLDSEDAGAARRARLDLLVSQSLGHLEQWFGSGKDFSSFMVGLTSEALIHYHSKTGDARVLPALKKAADGLWSRAWVADANAFRYSTSKAASEGTGPAPDLNLLIAPLYAWIYHQTGEQSYRDRGELIFAGGVTQAYLNNGKQFNQNYRWSFKYVEWRDSPPLAG
jgi:hypothetical protein